MKKLYPLAVLLFCSGCLLTTSDPEAERAAAIYNELHAFLPEKPLNLSDALAKAAPEDAFAVRLAFAKLETVSKNPNRTDLRVWGEKARVELNVMLGFLPADIIVYQTGGALDVPAEVSHIGAAEKAALIIHDGDTEPLELLKKVRIAHADAVAAMNQLAAADTPENRFAYFAACIHLADVIGVAPGDLDKLSEYEKRFNAASSRWKKSHETEE